MIETQTDVQLDTPQDLRLRRCMQAIWARMPEGSVEWAIESRPDLMEMVREAEASVDAAHEKGDRVERMAVEALAQAYGAIKDAYQEMDPVGFAELFPDEDAAAIVCERPARDWKYVQSEPELRAVLEGIAPAALLAVDLETTGLNPRTDRTRLISVATETDCWLVDCFALDPKPLLEALAGKKIVAHHALFDLGFLAALGCEPPAAECTMLLSQLTRAGLRDRHNLAVCAERELGQKVDKEQQLSDWRRSLSREQLEYAARDATLLLPLREKLWETISEGAMSRAATIESRCLPAVAWMARGGVGFDPDAWAVLLREAETEAAGLKRQMDGACPKKGTLSLGYGWNWDSHQECLEALQDCGYDIEDTADATLAGCDDRHALPALLRAYRGLNKRVTSYGQNWIDAVEGGRLYPSWMQLGSEAGRMSCREPNVQQIPRDPRYRACIIAPPGRVLVKADYSQIELRIAAKIANEERMLTAYQAGEDLHTLTARMMLGREDVTKADRQIAKSANFGLLYGMGATGYRIYAKTTYGVSFTEEEAIRYRGAFFRAYPGLNTWHQRTRSERVEESYTLAGRRRLFNAGTPDTHRLNTPVQGTGADGLKRALGLLWERRDECRGAFPVIACHDEICVECDESSAEEAAHWLKKCMLDGMAFLIKPVPVEVETSIGRTWGG